jgi:L-threonylcarbamoyladenylate synthase
MNKIIQPNNISIAAELLKAGQVVAMPTETVYGLAADIANEQAVKQIFALKGRPQNHPLIIHISEIEQLMTHTVQIPDYALQLAKHFWPGPLTLVLFKSAQVGDWVTGGQDTVGIRMPNHPLALELIKQVGSPLAAPSANLFGKISPTQAKHVQAEFGAALHIVDGGACEVGIESTIIDATQQDVCTILRPGMIGEQQIKAVLGSKILIQQPTDNSRKVSGTLKSHYSPQKPTFLFKDEEEFAALKSEFAISIYGLSITEGFNNSFKRFYLMPNDATAYAHKIYDALRQADNSDCEVIAIERPVGSEEWTAIMDRLERSCAKTACSTGAPVVTEINIL